MSMMKLATVLGSLVGLVGVAYGQQAKPATTAAPDTAALADKLVSVNVKVKEGNIVQIVAGPYDTALAEDLAVAVRKLGAFPLITFNSEAIAKKALAAVPDKYDAQKRKLDEALNKLVDVIIVIPQVRDPAIFAGLAPARAAAMAKAGQPAEDIARKRKVRVVELGNGFTPTAARAKELGISEADLKKVFWDGITADYTAVEQKCTALKTAIAAGKEIKITHPNGTDITFQIKGKKLFTSDGVISDADAKAGAPLVNAWLPAGEVYLVPGKSNGKIVNDREVAFGKDVTGLTLEIKDGKITSLTAKSGWDGSAIKGRYDAAGAGKNELSVLDFGCNSAVKAGLENFVPAGNVTVFFGDNQWAGGTNKEPFGMTMFLPGTTVALDGKPIIENGTLK